MGTETLRYPWPVRALICVVLLCACGDSETALLVYLRTDYTPAELESFELSLVGAETRTLETMPRGDLLEGVLVAELHVGNGRHRVRGRAFSPSEQVLQSREVLVLVEGRTAITIVMTRSCESIVCSGEGRTECVGGECVSPECTPETPDACGATGCEDTTDCSPTLACGAARCVAGVCLETLDDGRCTSQATCTRDGCVSGADAGMDAGTEDSGVDADRDDADDGSNPSCAADLTGCGLFEPTCEAALGASRCVTVATPIGDPFLAVLFDVDTGASCSSEIAAMPEFGSLNYHLVQIGSSLALAVYDSTAAGSCWNWIISLDTGEASMMPLGAPTPEGICERSVRVGAEIGTIALLEPASTGELRLPSIGTVPFALPFAATEHFSVSPRRVRDRG